MTVLLLNKNAITVKGPLENKITYIEVFFATLPSLSHTYILCTYVLNFINTKRHHLKCKIIVFKCQKWFSYGKLVTVSNYPKKRPK